MGATSRSHLNLTAANGAWETVQDDTRRKYIRALIEAGIPEDRFSDQSPGRTTLDRGDLARAEEIAVDIALDRKYTYEAALAKAVQIKHVAGTDIAWRRQTLNALEEEARAPRRGEALTAAEAPLDIKRYTSKFPERAGNVRGRKSARK